MRINVKQVAGTLAVTVALPLVALGQQVERFALGADAVVWGAPDLDSFSLSITGTEGTAVHEIGDTVLYGIRPFIRIGASKEFAAELSHEFVFGDDVDVMVSSATAILRPFGKSGLEVHASLCFGQMDWDGPGGFDSAWGWEVGAGYTFKLSDSAVVLIGIAYRDVSFHYDLEGLVEELPKDSTVSLPDESVDSAGVVGTAGFFVIF